MPKLKLTGPNGEIKTVSVSEVPNESQMQEIISNVFSGPTELAGPAPAGAPSSPTIDTGASPPLASTAASLEQSRDIQESQTRPSLGEFAIEAAGSARGEIGNLIDLGVTFAKSPIQSSKKIKQAASNLTKEQAAEFGVDLAKDFGKTFGFDIERPGQGLDKFDIDTAIERWQNQPLGVIGDVNIFLAGAKAASVAVKAGKSLNKIATHKALKRSGDEIKDMAEGMAEAKAKAISRGAKIETLSPGEEVALRADVIKKIPLKELNGSLSMSL